jgi:hypothetical protein
MKSKKWNKLLSVHAMKAYREELINSSIYCLCWHWLEGGVWDQSMPALFPRMTLMFSLNRMLDRSKVICLDVYIVLVHYVETI